MPSLFLSYFFIASRNRSLPPERRRDACDSPGFLSCSPRLALDPRRDELRESFLGRSLGEEAAWRSANAFRTAARSFSSSLPSLFLSCLLRTSRNRSRRLDRSPRAGGPSGRLPRSPPALGPRLGGLCGPPRRRSEKDLCASARSLSSNRPSLFLSKRLRNSGIPRPGSRPGPRSNPGPRPPPLGPGPRPGGWAVAALLATDTDSSAVRLKLTKRLNPVDRPGFCRCKKFSPGFPIWGERATCLGVR